MADDLLQHFDRLTIWRRGDERAPHKPLLALWAIGQCLQGQDRLIEYNVIHNSLLVLLQKFGPPRKTYKPQEPFWRMQKDKIWDVPQADLVPQHAGGGVSPTRLRDLNILGGLPAPLYDAFRSDPALALRVARKLVDSHFPWTMRSAVLEATLGDHAFSLSPATEYDHSSILGPAFGRRNRNSKFRKSVLETYDYKCAVCEYSFEFPAGHWPALEAAHIRWHSHEGPDESENGLSLCVLHHELFDWGIFTVQPDTLNIMVTRAILEKDTDNPITDLHGTPLQTIPGSRSDRPATEHLNWHTKNVFRGA